MARDTWKKFDRNPISHSVAHHIIAIAELRERSGYARVSDVAKLLNITRGSASLTLKTLKQRGLVLEDENRFLLLSPEGEAVAGAVRGKKFLLQSFFHNILGVPQQTAEEDTCKIEHLISNETAERLAKFVRLVNSGDKRAAAFNSAWRKYNDPCDHNPEGCPACNFDCLLNLCREDTATRQTSEETGNSPQPATSSITTPACLAELAVGQSGRIARIVGNGALRQRLLDMGITRGETVRVQRFAPLGDPIEVVVKGCSLAIRKSEARSIQLEP